jgi:hypothetical protein
MPRSLARRRRRHLVIAALIALAIAVFEIVSDEDKADPGLVPIGPAGGSGTAASDRARELGLASKLPAGLPRSAGATYYVSHDGDDANPGTSEQPWGTIQKALDTLLPGERVVVGGGTYVEDLVMSRSGTPDAPITIAAEAGETAVLQPAAREGDTYAIRFAEEASYVRLQGFVIEGATGISSTNVYFEDEVHDIELAANEIRFSQDQGVFSERTTSNLTLVGNRIHDNGRGHVPGQHQSHGMYIEGRGHLIANNVIYDNPEGFGIQIYPANEDTIVVNNTILRSGHSGIVMGGSDGVDGLVVRNNIVAGNEDYGISMDDSCPTDSVVDTNLVYENEGGGVEGGCDGVDTSGRNFTADPDFIDAERDHFGLRRTSAAIDRARVAWTPLTDVRGRQRPWGASGDIGAYEGAG